MTGSATLVECANARVLVDFGLFQGAISQERRNLLAPDIDFEKLDAVVCTHAHIDHCGRLGMLPGLGYDRFVFCHEATAMLLPRVLASSANLQQTRLTEYRMGTAPEAVVIDPPPDPARARLQERTEDPPVLYSRGEAEHLCRGIVGLPYQAWREIAPGVRLRLHDAGHVIGSASAELELQHGASRVRVVLSGDVGPVGETYLATRPNAPEADVVVMESTTGARPDDAPVTDTLEALAEIARDARENGRVALLPTFSVGRAQVLVHHLARLSRQGRLGVPVYLDSPMAIRAGEICCAHPQLLSEDARRFLGEGRSPLNFEELQFIWSRKQSLKLLAREGAAIVLAGSGFCDAGPVLHHLQKHLPHEHGHLVFTGYVLPGSLAEALAEGTARRVRINGKEMHARARVTRLHGLSGHADPQQMTRWLVAEGHAPGLVLLNHGDDGARQALAARLARSVSSRIELPAYGTSVQIG